MVRKTFCVYFDPRHETNEKDALTQLNDLSRSSKWYSY